MSNISKRDVVEAIIRRRLGEWKDCRIYMSDIAREADVSVETVRQVFRSQFNLTRADQVSARAQRVENRKMEAKAQREIGVYGNSLSDLRSRFGVDNVNLLMPRYRASKYNSIRMYGRSNTWNLSFGDWLVAWKESGFSVDHPRRICLMRRDYTKPYQLGNVKFVLVDKTGEARLLKKSQMAMP